MKYLIFNMSGIGDLLWIYPYCKAIKEYDKEAYITLYSGADTDKKHIERKGEALSFLDAVDKLDYYNKDEPIHTLFFLARTKIKRYDYSFCILDYETGTMGNACARIAVKMGKTSIGLEQRNLKNVKFSITIPRRDDVRNRRYYYAEMLKAIGIEPLEYGKRCIDEDILDTYVKSTGILFNEETKYVGLVVGAGYGAYVENGVYHYIDIKNWPIENWIVLATRLVDDGFKPILLGGYSEKKKLQDIESKLPMGIINMVGKTTLGESLAIVSKCKLLISGDTGLVHGAFLVETPVLALFGGTDPEVIFPQAKRNRVLSTKEECAPCWNDNEKKRQCKNVKCMKNITVDMVHGAALDMLQIEYTIITG